MIGKDLIGNLIIYCVSGNTKSLFIILKMFWEFFYGGDAIILKWRKLILCMARSVVVNCVTALLPLAVNDRQL